MKAFGSGIGDIIAYDIKCFLGGIDAGKTYVEI
jgi:hypothetical protein